MRREVDVARAAARCARADLVVDCAQPWLTSGIPGQRAQIQDPDGCGHKRSDPLLRDEPAIQPSLTLVNDPEWAIENFSETAVVAMYDRQLRERWQGTRPTLTVSSMSSR